MDYERLTTGQAAKIAGLSVSTLKRKIGSRELHATRGASGEYAIRHDELMRFLAAHEPSSRAGATSRSPAGRIAEPTTSRNEERLERALEELKAEKMRLVARVDELEREKRAILAEYHAMTAKLLQEREDELAALKAGSVIPPEPVGVPTKFLKNIRKKAVGMIRDVIGNE